MPSTWIYLVRHGSVVGTHTHRFIGHLDVPISETGEAELNALAARLSKIPLVAVYTSDLIRARRSAEIVAAPHGLTPRVTSSLREMAMGRWEGLTAEEIKAREPEAFSDWMSKIGEYPCPEGESVPDLVARSWPVVERILAAHVGEHVAVVAHGGTNRVVLCRALRLPLERLVRLGQDYGALSILEWTDSCWTLHLLNDADYSSSQLR
jgi:broad specificity phosphatase PhoE